MSVLKNNDVPHDVAVDPPVRDEQAVRQFVERFALALADSGMARMPARIFVRLLATDNGQLTAAELAEQLEVSPAAVSGAVRYLIHVGMIVRDREPGTRRDHYRVTDDVWYELYGQRDGLISALVKDLSSGVDALGRGTPAGDRIAESVAFFEFMLAELPDMVERWRKVKEERFPNSR